MFVEIPRHFLASINTENDRTPMYFSGNVLLRECFWLRLRLLYALIRLHGHGRRNCLDFGGGKGVFLPTLSPMFGTVSCIDLDCAEARDVVAHYRLPNVALHERDIGAADLAEAPFDAIVAADVLEHFLDPAPAVAAIGRWLAPDGVLFTSLPTENWVYVMLRKVFGITKPPDHYHTGYEVEAYLAAHGFRRVRRLFVPLVLQLAPLFIVSAWRRDRDGE